MHPGTRHLRAVYYSAQKSNGRLTIIIRIELFSKVSFNFLLRMKIVNINIPVNN